jgi:hypothetical protein
MFLTTGSVAEVKISVTDVVLKCENAIKKITQLQENSRMVYKDEIVYMYYCKDQKGNYVG